jgi:hypothetical protein
VGDWRGPSALAVIVALGGLAATAFSVWRQNQNHKSELIQSSFSWLAGDTQDRNIGIAVAEHFWAKEPKYHDTWLRLFTNQAVYLLADQFDRKAQDHKRASQDVLQRLDEELSLQRLMKKLVENKCKIGELQCDYLLYAIQKRLEDDQKYNLPDKSSDDKNRVTKDQLCEWKKQLKEVRRESGP